MCKTDKHLDTKIDLDEIDDETEDFKQIIREVFDGEEKKEYVESDIDEKISYFPYNSKKELLDNFREIVEGIKSGEALKGAMSWEEFIKEMEKEDELEETKE
jgi:hypothetical protein